MSELRRDLQNRFPIRVSGEGISEDESARLADEEPFSLQAEAARLKQEAAKLKGEPGGLPAARAKEETAKLEETIAALKDGLFRAATVADAVKYAEGVDGLADQGPQASCPWCRPAARPPARSPWARSRNPSRI